MDVNPIPVKQAMRAMGYDVGECRLPLCDMDSVKTERLLQVLRDYGLVEELSLIHISEAIPAERQTG